jgi:uncharacterized protein YndB with AHSA1/START domain
VPTVRLSRTVAASPAEVWEVVSDPHHLPRWWPRVVRVEGVNGNAFTEVLRSDRGRIVRADFRLAEAQPPSRVAWEQEVAGTPFARVLRSAHTEIALGGDRTTEVTIEMRQTLRGFFARLGGWLVRRAAAATLRDALDGLERIFGQPS